MYGYLRNLKRATTFLRYRKTGSSPKLGQHPPRFTALIRSGSKRWSREDAPGIWSLTWPGTLLLLVAFAAAGEWDTPFVPVGIPACALMFVRAYSAESPRRVRVVGMVASALPVVVFLLAVLT